VRKLFRRLFRLGLLAGIGYGIWRYFEKQRGESGVGWEAQPFPYPPQPREQEKEATSSRPLAGDKPAPAPAATATDKAWVEPNGDTCPATHPIKAKMSSHIFHLPGGANYARTNPDRCYRDEAAAEADGLRKAAR
jgi:hypothetical protein